jgi:hypothetical protein
MLDMQFERAEHVGNEKANLTDKGERKKTYDINETANISEIQDREHELQLKV